MLTCFQDVKFDNGIVHIVDSVILPPFSVSATAKAANLTDLVNALVATNLAGAVDSMKDVTIFAPTNMAFGATPENLTVAQLSEILTFHVVPNAVAYSTSLKDGQNITTLAGKQLTVKITDGVVSVNGAKVIAADVLVNSGVVHVIDA